MTQIETVAVVLPATALLYGTLLEQVANVVQAQGDPEHSRKALRIAQVAAAVLIITAAATRGVPAAVAASVVVGAVAYYWDRWVLA